MTRLLYPEFLVAGILALTSHLVAEENWPQAAGPNNNWQVEGNPPKEWSATRNENIRWRTTLPEAGMSGVTVWKDRLFVTTHVPIKTQAEKNGVSDILGFCLHADTGEILWQVELPGSVFISLAGGFTDGTVFAPITDGEHVWFFNRCGSMGCYTFEGKPVWLREWKPRFKHNNRQAEPFLVGDTILYVEVANKEEGAKMQKWQAPGKKAPKGSLKVPDGVNPNEVWTYVHGIDKKTGEVVWREQVGTVVHNTPVVGYTAAGEPAIAHARGGPHGPLEKPAGQSLTSLARGKEGETLWSTPINGYDPSFASHWNEKYVLGFQGGKHLVMDAKTGAVIREQPLEEGALLWKYDPKELEWVKETDARVTSRRPHANTNQANLLVGSWHWFLTHDFPYIGRVHIETGVTEYLELPAQIIASEDARSKDVELWGKPYPNNEPTNASGFAVGDKGHTSSGWGHISAASPVRVGKFLFVTLVTGSVHVIDTSVETLSPDALIASNDLGVTGETWTLAPLTFANGRFYAHTMREVICIE
ncbi:MAG: PQQ-binding-like beta-propeller repeat protein [Verrucomicrobiota bacterium]